MSSSFFLDRSLGDFRVPQGLRKAGWTVVTMRERYGKLPAQSLADVDWIADAAAQEEIMLTADKSIAKRPREVGVVVRAQARVVALKDGRVTAQQQVDLFLAHASALMALEDRKGPFVLTLSTRGLTTLDLRV